MCFLPPGSQVEPFEAAYAEIKTKTVQMEERNIYCCEYFDTVLLGKLVHSYLRVPK